MRRVLLFVLLAETKNPHRNFACEIKLFKEGIFRDLGGKDKCVFKLVEAFT